MLRRGRVLPDQVETLSTGEQSRTSMREALSSAVNWQICSPMPAAENVPRCRRRFT